MSNPFKLLKDTLEAHLKTLRKAVEAGDTQLRNKTLQQTDLKPVLEHYIRGQGWRHPKVLSKLKEKTGFILVISSLRDRCKALGIPSTGQARNRGSLHWARRGYGTVFSPRHPGFGMAFFQGLPAPVLP